MSAKHILALSSSRNWQADTGRRCSMTPAEFHKVCHDAILKCPQVNGYKINDTLYPSYEKFWDLPKRGWAAVIRFWEKDDTLWRSGYHEYLPKEAKEIFRKAAKVSCEAIQKHVEVAAISKAVSYTGRSM